MITDTSGARQTPKQRAQNEILHAITNSLHQFDATLTTDEQKNMTQREYDLVCAHIVKQTRRIEKMFGYEPGSWAVE
jgi:cob(I)alamin adenosyltransferase